jgi:eukaryotic-like serine/threonine-protein kinase
MATRKRIKAERIASSIVVGVCIFFALAFLVGMFFLIRSFTGYFGKAEGGNIIVPKVIGMTEEQALNALERLQLQGDVTDKVNNDDQPSGKIFSQDPEPGATVKTGKRVRMSLSLGSASYTVPDLTGQPLAKATETIARARLTVGEIVRIYSRGNPAGRVLNQTPAPGTILQASTNVDLVVCDNAGVPKFAMPDLSGKPLAEAEQLLAKQNLHLSKVTYVASDTITTGSVVKQSVETGKEVKYGDKVELEVAQTGAFMQSPIRTITLRIVVPPGPPKQHVKIVYTDKLGTQVRGDAEHEPGDTVEEKIDLEGPAKVQIFICDMKTPFREEIL